MKKWGVFCLWLAAAPAMGATGGPAVATGVQAPPLVAAAKARQSVRALELLKAGQALDVDQRSADGTTALHWAVYYDDVALVDRLLAAGANPNARNDYQATPMV